MLSFEKARKVPPMVTESGITLNAPPPWNLATVTTCKRVHFMLNGTYDCQQPQRLQNCNEKENINDVFFF